MSIKESNHSMRKLLSHFRLFFILFIMLTGCASIESQRSTESQISDIHLDIQSIQEKQELLQKELSEIKKLLSAQANVAEKEKPRSPPQQPPLPMTMDISKSPTMGNKNAPLVLIEFTDYQCPFCRRHFETVHQQLVKTYVDTGQLKLVLKEFPLQKLHPNAPRAAMAAQCAGSQNSYWPMHDLLFRNQTRVQMADLKSFAVSLGLDSELFMNCMKERLFTSNIIEDFNLGVTAGVKGTPFFFFGRNNKTSPDMITVEQYFYGAKTFEEFKQMIDTLLSTKNKQ
jgi:protein-disulfide isomerase